MFWSDIQVELILPFVEKLKLFHREWDTGEIFVVTVVFLVADRRCVRRRCCCWNRCCSCCSYCSCCSCHICVCHLSVRSRLIDEINTTNWNDFILFFILFFAERGTLLLGEASDSFPAKGLRQTFSSILVVCKSSSGFPMFGRFKMILTPP